MLGNFELNFFLPLIREFANPIFSFYFSLTCRSMEKMFNADAMDSIQQHIREIAKSSFSVATAFQSYKIAQSVTHGPTIDVCCASS